MDSIKMFIADEVLVLRCKGWHNPRFGQKNEYNLPTVTIYISNTPSWDPHQPTLNVILMI